MINLTLNSGQISDLGGVKPSLMVVQTDSGSFKAATTSDLRGSSNGELDIYRNLSLNTGGANIKSSAGAVYGYYITNKSDSIQHVKFYDFTGVPVVGTTIPVLTFAVPSSGGANLSIERGIKFISGIAVGATVGSADNNTTSPAANDVIVNIFYK